MNGKDREDLQVVLYRLDEHEKKLDGLKTAMEIAHNKTEETLEFVRKNLFDPDKGLWAETKLNSQFRENTTKWRTVTGTAIVGIVGKFIHDLFKNS